MADAFASYSSSMTAPPRNAATVTPNDSADLPNVARGLACSAAGTVTVDMVGVGTNIAIPVAAGQNAMVVSRVYATGTSAGTIVALW